MPADFLLGDWLIQPTLNRASKGGQTIHIRPKVMDLLLVLSSQPGVVLSKDALVAAAWGTGFVSDSALTTVVAELRQVFHDDVEHPWLLETIPKRGYRLVAEVRLAEAASDPPAPAPILPNGRGLDAQAARQGNGLPSEPSSHARRAGLVFVLATAAIALPTVWLNSTLIRNRPAPIQDVAVLPFQDLSATPANELLADGITGGLISELSRLDGLQRVVAHASVMRFKAPPPQSLKDVAKELRVQAIITGTLVRIDNQIRIRVELIDGLTERQLWGDTFVREAGAITDVQRQVVRDIVRETRVQVTPAQQRRLDQVRRRTNPDAYSLVVKARAESALINYRAAVRYYEQALELDPDMTEALAELALTLVYHAYANPTPTLLPRAQHTANRAIELDPDNAVSRVALGRIRLHVDWDWDGAGRELRRAIDLDPHSPEAHWVYGFYLGVMGRLDESVREARAAVNLDPLSPITHYQHAFQLRVARQYRSAVEAFTTAIALAPNRPIFKAQRAVTHAINGDCALADADLAAAGQTLSAAFVAAKCGRHEEARLAATALRNSGGCAADVYAALGDHDAAFACLDERFARHDFSLAQLPTAPLFIDLQHDRRFEDLLRRMGYPR